MDWLIGFGIGVVSGVLASAIVLAADRWLGQRRLKGNLGYLEGAYRQLNLQLEPILNGGAPARSTLHYAGDATFEVKSSTSYGDWTGRVKLDPALPTQGSGTFAYTNSAQGNGIIQIVVLENRSRILVNSLALDFVGSAPATYWLEKE